MTAAESAERAAHYDPRDVQEKWLARWDELDLFRASDDPADGRPRTYLLDMFPYPSGDLHMGHAEAYAIADAVARYYVQRGRQRAAPDRLGRVRAARGERRDPEQHPSGRLDLPEHRDPGRLVPPVCGVVRLVPAAADLRPGLLPLEPVAVPAVLRARAGLPQGRLRQLVPGTTRPCWPTSRSSRASASGAAPR